MSNYSRIIVCWPFEGPLHAEETPEVVRGRAAEIAEAAHLTIEEVTYPCPHSAVRSSCCETTVTYAANHVIVEDILRAISALDWDTPEEVQFFVKDEHAERYMHYAMRSDHGWDQSSGWIPVELPDEDYEEGKF